MTKPLIVKRLVKGSALTFTEQDANFQNLDDATITLRAGAAGVSVVSDLNGVITLIASDGILFTGNNTSKEIAVDAALVRDTTPQLAGDLDVQTFRITTSVTNGNIEIDPPGTGRVIISGDLQVDGTTTTINSTTVDIDDKNITLAKGAVNAAAADGGGITVEGPTIPATILYDDFNDGWVVNKPFEITSNNASNGGSGPGAFFINAGASGKIEFSAADQIMLFTGAGTVNSANKLTLSAASTTIEIEHTNPGNIILTPRGTGDVHLVADTVRVGDVNATATVTTNGTGTLLLNTNAGTNSGTITINQGANSDIDIEPNGTGNVDLIADTVVLGDAGAAATLTTNGAGTLTINTNAGTNAGTIVLTQGANGNITISPNGTGNTVTNNTLIAQHTPATAGQTPFIGRSTVTIANSIRYANVNLQKTRSDILLAAMTNEPAVLVYSVRDSANTNRIFASTRAVYQGTGTNPLFAFDVSVDGFSTTVNCVNFGGTQANWGNGAGNYTLSTLGAGSLILSTNQGSTTGNITIESGSNTNIVQTVHGTGAVQVKNTGGTNIASMALNRIYFNWAVRGDTTPGQTVAPGATFTVSATSKQYIELQITTGAANTVTIDVSAITVVDEGGHYAILIHNNSGHNQDIDILNGGVTLSSAAKNLHHASRHICTVYCVGAYAAVEIMDAV